MKKIISIFTIASYICGGFVFAQSSRDTVKRATFMVEGANAMYEINAGTVRQQCAEYAGWMLVDSAIYYKLSEYMDTSSKDVKALIQWANVIISDSISCKLIEWSSFVKQSKKYGLLTDIVNYDIYAQVANLHGKIVIMAIGPCIVKLSKWQEIILKPTANRVAIIHCEKYLSIKKL